MTAMVLPGGGGDGILCTANLREYCQLWPNLPGAPDDATNADEMCHCRCAPEPFSADQPILRLDCRTFTLLMIAATALPLKGTANICQWEFHHGTSPGLPHFYASFQAAKPTDT